MFSYTNSQTGQCGCECGQLPYTITLTLVGVPPEGRAGYGGLVFSSCFGFGAAAAIVEPGGSGEEARGPLSQVALLSPGECYAVLGRVAPTFTLYGYGDSKGGEFEVSLTVLPDECGRPRWAIESVAVTGGEGYADNAVLDVLPGLSVITVEKAVLRVRATDGVPTSIVVDNGGLYYEESRSVPPIVANVSVTGISGGGSGAEIAVTVDEDVESATFGQISSLSITKAGDGYLAWQPANWPCGVDLHDSSVVLKATNPKVLVRACATASFGTPPTLVIDSSGYDGTPSPIQGITLVSGGSGMAVKGRAAPSLSVQTNTGAGAIFTVSLEESQDSDGEPIWSVASVETNQAGQGYTDNALVDIAWSPGVRVERAVARLWARDRPDVVVEPAVEPLPGGEPATLSAVLVRNAGYPPTWSVDALSIDAPGSNYPQRVPLVIAESQESTEGRPAAAVAYADELGKLVRAEVRYGGEFYRLVGRAMEVEVLRGGAYYAIDSNAEPRVAAVSAVIEQVYPSQGSGASISLDLDDNPSSPSFGQVTKATLVSGGSGYELFGGPKSCGGQNQYTAECGGGSGLSLDLVQPAVPGRNRGLRVDVESSSTETSESVDMVFRSPDAVLDCGQLPGTLPAVLGQGSIVVARGGRVFPGGYGYCCTGCQAVYSQLDHVESITVVATLSAIAEFQPGYENQPCSGGQITVVLNAANAWAAGGEAPLQQLHNPPFPVWENQAVFAAGLRVSDGGFFLSMTAAWNGNCRTCPGTIAPSLSEKNILLQTMELENGSKCVPVGRSWAYVPEPGSPDCLNNTIVGLQVTVALK